jgi:hypothetical protein
MRNALPETDVAQQTPAPERPSRRSFVFFGALAATALLPIPARAQVVKRKLSPSSRGPAIDPTTMRPSESVSAPSDWTSKTGRLVRRATMGVMPAEMTRATDMGYQGYLNYQLNHTRINDDVAEGIVAAKWPLMSQSSEALFSADSGVLRSQLQESTLYRAAFSQRQLYHRMVELWSDHFNQDYDKVGYLLVADQRDVIRANALGTFPALLKASKRAGRARRTRTTPARSWSCTRSASTAVIRRPMSPSCRACSRDGRSREKDSSPSTPRFMTRERRPSSARRSPASPGRRASTRASKC